MNEAPELMTATTATTETPAAIAVAPAVPPRVSPFRKGELVVYPTHGVGTVDRVGFEEIGGQRLNLIHVSFTESRMTLRIPVIKATAVGLRRPNTREALQEVLTVLTGRSRASKIVWVKRAQEYAARINSGSIKALAVVIRDLRPGPDGPRSSFSQRNLFEVAIDRLAAEFAAVFKIEKAAALDRLTQILHSGAAADFDVGAEAAVEGRRVV
jgi:CarD family transcriptional regulator